MLISKEQEIPLTDNQLGKENAHSIEYTIKYISFCLNGTESSFAEIIKEQEFSLVKFAAGSRNLEK